MKAFAVRAGSLAIAVLLFSTAAAAEKKARRAGTVLYDVKDSASAEELARLDAAMARHSLKIEKVLRNGKTKLAKVSKASALSEEELAAEIQATGAVEFAEPDYRVAPTLMPNDPSFGSQWHHAKIGSAQAWDRVTGSAGVKVAVCDSGFDTSHPDLAANFVLPGINTADNSTNVGPNQGHGTKVAGTVAAVGNNGLGVSGMAWKLQILPGRITNDPAGYAYYSDMSECINWGANQGAKVVNLSYGGCESATIDSAARYLRSKGGLLFMSAGNDGREMTGTDFTSFVIVGATDSGDNKTSWSNWGGNVDLVAPGSGILTTSDGGGYASVSGTSFSSPVTAGAAALLFSVNPGFTPDQVESMLFSTTKDLGAVGDDSVYGHGRLDVAAAVMKAVGVAGNIAPSPVISATPMTGTAPVSVSFDASASSDADGSVIAFAWDFGDGASATGVTASHVYSNPGSYPVTLTVTDDLGAKASSSVTIQVNPDPSKLLSVARIDMSLLTLKTGTQAVAKVVVQDAGLKLIPGATVSGTWSGLVSGTVSGVTGADGSVSLVSPKSRKSGTITFKVTNISAPGYGYDASKNVETQDSIVK